MAQPPWGTGDVGGDGDRQPSRPRRSGPALRVPFIHIPASRDIREQAEQRQLDLLRGNVDLVVLARYMQILTPHFLEAVGCR